MEEAAADQPHQQASVPPSPSPSSPPTASGHHFLVPVNSADSQVPAFAVLRFLGFSSASSAFPALPIGFSSSVGMVSLQRSPIALNAAQNHSAPSIGGYGVSAESSSSSGKLKDKVHKRGKTLASFLLRSPMKKRGAKKGNHNANKGKRRPSSSSSDTSSCPSPVIDTAPLPPPRVTISHTQRETVIHTNCSNFRDVVRRLTGATKEDNYLMPVTVSCIRRSDSAPSPLKVTSRHRQNQHSTKLFERRRSTQTLSTKGASSSSLSLSICGTDLPPLVPSPVTPLASDLERISVSLSPLAVAATCVPNATTWDTLMCNAKPLMPSSSSLLPEAPTDDLAVLAYRSKASLHRRPSVALLPLFPEFPCR